MNWIKNLSTHQAFPGKPWEFTDAASIPANVRENKKERHNWITNLQTQHNVYSLFEGVNQNVRVSAQTKDGGGNPPQYCYGIVADYDTPLDETDVRRACEKFPHKPNWYEITLSGHARIIWLFENKLPLPPSVSQVAKFFRECVLSKGRFDAFLPALDQGAFADPARRFTNSGQWIKLHDDLLPDDLVRGWFVQYSSKLQWDLPEYGCVVPLDAVKDALAEKYPRFGEWQGEFTLGAQGPSFWVDGSVSPKSAIVRETGIYTFADHAHKNFFTWSDLLGAEFVAEYETQQLGRATEGIYFDSKSYWIQDGSGIWRPNNKEDTREFVKIVRRVSDRRARLTNISPLDEAMTFIRNQQRIDGAAPFVHRPPGQPLNVGPHRILNIARTDVIKPASGTATWGPQGEFPFISMLIDTLFDPPSQKDYLLAEVQYQYCAALEHEPVQLHHIFICGGVGVGKTLLSRQVIGQCMGGFANVAKYLTGQDSFGGEIFEVSIWCIDDAEAIGHPKFHRTFSEMLKSSNANIEHRYHQKFQVASQVFWCGRVIGTLNDDPQSKQQLPNMGIGSSDKVALFKAISEKKIEFPSQPRIRQILEVERPYFLRWLVDWKRPDFIKYESRFGFERAYHDPGLLEGAHQSSSVAAFREILSDVLTDWFKGNKDDFWEGSSFQLHRLLNSDAANLAAMRDYTVHDVGREMGVLQNQGLMAISSRSLHGMRLWKVMRPEKEPAEAPVIPPQPANSIYDRNSDIR